MPCAVPVRGYARLKTADREVIYLKHYCNRQTANSGGGKKMPNTGAAVQKTEKTCRANQKAAENSERLKSEDTDENDEVVFPPGTACGYLKDSGVAVRVFGEAETEDAADSEPNTGEQMDYGTGEGGALSQMGTYRRQLRENSKTGYTGASDSVGESVIAHNMSGRFNFLSVPRAESGILNQTMPMYLNNYLGKYICLDLWTCERVRIEKCGVLTDVGADFIAIKNVQNGNRTVIDLKTIRYVSIFCR